MNGSLWQSLSRHERLDKAATQTREMHRLYPFTKVVSSAAKKGRKR